MAKDFEDDLHRIRTEVEVKVHGGWTHKLSFEEAQAVAEAIQRNPLLKTLRFAHCSFSLEQVEALTSGLRDSSVSTLGFWCTYLEDQGVSAVAAVLRDSSIQSLDLGGNKIQVAGAQALAEGLRSSSVTSLNLWCNCLEDAGVIALVGALKESSVRLLNLGRNHFGNEGVTALAAALKETSVTSLGVADNDIKVEGAQALLEGLQDSPVIEMLHLEHCNVCDKTRSEIQKILEANKARNFLLQMRVQKFEDELQLKFHTMGGSEAAILTWSMDSPLQDLPEAVLSSMRSSGFPLPFRGLCAVHLKIVCPDGAILDVSRTAAPWAQQVGLTTQPSGFNSSKRLFREVAQ